MLVQLKKDDDFAYGFTVPVVTGAESAIRISIIDRSNSTSTSSKVHNVFIGNYADLPIENIAQIAHCNIKRSGH